MVLAHPDDEVIFGWPILQDKTIKKQILICSSDRENPERRRYAHRKYSLYNLCKFLNIQCTCLDYNSTFYRVDARQGELKALGNHISKTIKAQNYDYIFTHNPIGEYGMLDHILVHNIVMTTIDKNIIISDMFIESNWSYVTKMPGIYKELYFTGNNIWKAKCSLNRNFYKQCKEFYIRDQTWTWSKPPITSCNLYIIGKH